MQITGGVHTVGVLYAELPERPKIITAFNVFAHVRDPNEFIYAAANTMADDGVLVLEFPYLVPTVEENQWDSIYHEHISYLLLSPVQKLLKKYGLNIVNCYVDDIYGGSLHIEARKSTLETVIISLSSRKEKEWIDNGDELIRWGRRINDQSFKLRELIHGKRVVGYGAPAKATTLLNVFDIRLDYVVDENPLKIGKFIPGVDTPIVHTDALDNKDYDYILILAWNYNTEIMSKVREWYPEAKFILLPEVKLV